MGKDEGKWPAAEPLSEAKEKRGKRKKPREQARDTSKGEGKEKGKSPKYTRRRTDAESRALAGLTELAHDGADPRGPLSRELKLQRIALCRYLYINGGLALEDAATQSHLVYPVAKYHCRKGNWSEQRVRYQALSREARDAMNVVDRAIARKELISAQIAQSAERLEFFSRAIHRKMLAATADTKIAKFTTADGKKHQIPVPRADEKTLADMLKINATVARQWEALGKLNDAAVLKDVRRLQRAKTRIEDSASHAWEEEEIERKPLRYPGGKTASVAVKPKADDEGGEED